MNKTENERIKLLREVQQLHFLLVETGLFLNTQSKCEAAQEAFAKYQKQHAEAKAKYEDRYGPLTYEGVNAECDGWSWVYGPWPWEVEDC